jgi:hypothetical protein
LTLFLSIVGAIIAVVVSYALSDRTPAPAPGASAIGEVSAGSGEPAGSQSERR